MVFTMQYAEHGEMTHRTRGADREANRSPMALDFRKDYSKAIQLYRNGSLVTAP